MNSKSVLQQKKKSQGWLFILSVLLVYPLPQVAIDVYLPSWPAMVNYFHTSRDLLQLSLTVYILFLGLAQLVYGPLSDRFGRKPILLIGIIIFFFSTVLCAASDSISWLLIFRGLQGLGIGCGFTVASSILADVFEGGQLAKITSYSAMIYSLSLILSPVLGSYIQQYFGWRANFIMMAIYAVALFLLTLFFVCETKDDKKIVLISFREVVKNYCLLFTSLKFIGAVLCLTLAYGIMISFNIVGPFLLQKTLQVTVVHYGQLLLVVGFCYFFGATVNSRLIKYLGTDMLIIFGLFLITSSGIGLLISSLLGWISVMSILLFVCVALFGLGFIYPNCFAYALDIFPEKGYASSLIGSVILIGVSLISIVVSRYNIGHQYCLSFTFLILAILSILSFLLTRLLARK